MTSLQADRPSSNVRLALQAVLGADTLEMVKGVLRTYLYLRKDRRFLDKITTSPILLIPVVYDSLILALVRRYRGAIALVGAIEFEDGRHNAR